MTDQEFLDAAARGDIEVVQAALDAGQKSRYSGRTREHRIDDGLRKGTARCVQGTFSCRCEYQS